MPSERRQWWRTSSRSPGRRRRSSSRDRRRRSRSRRRRSSRSRSISSSAEREIERRKVEKELVLDDWTWLRSKVGVAKALDTSEALEAQSQADLNAQVVTLDEVEARQFVAKCFVGDASECEELFRQVSLLDPISLCRINLPVRSKHCTHIQCFDLRTHFINNFLGEKTYLKLSLEKNVKAIGVAKRLWRCPICSVLASRGLLQIDPFTRRIIEETAPETARVLIRPTGKYTVCAEREEGDVASDDDIDQAKKEPANIEDEIDLTLSDDEMVMTSAPLPTHSSSSTAAVTSSFVSASTPASSTIASPLTTSSSTSTSSNATDQPSQHPHTIAATTTTQTLTTTSTITTTSITTTSDSLTSNSSTTTAAISLPVAAPRPLSPPKVLGDDDSMDDLELYEPDFDVTPKEPAPSYTPMNTTQESNGVMTLTAQEAFVVISSAEVNDDDSAEWLRGKASIFEPHFMHECDSSGHSPLTAAAAVGKLKTLRVLVEQGGNVRTRQLNGHDTLTAALLNGHFEVCDYLTSQMGMDLNYAKGFDHPDASKKVLEFVQYRLARAKNPSQPSASAASASGGSLPAHILEQIQVARSQLRRLMGAFSYSSNEAESFPGEDGKPFTFPDGSVYVGTWKNGRAHGQGKRMWEETNYYDGAWHEGRMHGHGKREWASGAIYLGMWKEDKFHGKGKLTRPSGYVHDGEWLDGHRNGSGRMVSSTGEKSAGVWKDDRFVEAFCFKCGAPMTSGKWHVHRCDGKPLCRVPGPHWDLSRPGFNPDFDALTKECELHKITTSSGTVESLVTRLKAHFLWHEDFDSISTNHSRSKERSRKHSRDRSRKRSRDRSRKRSRSRNRDRSRKQKSRSKSKNMAEKSPKSSPDMPFCGINKYVFPDGGAYDGFWQNSKRHGFGKFVLPSGEVYEGQWKDDNRHGHGICTLASGEFYEGQWADDSPVRKGRYCWPDGVVFVVDAGD